MRRNPHAAALGQRGGCALAIRARRARAVGRHARRPPFARRTRLARRPPGFPAHGAAVRGRGALRRSDGSLRSPGARLRFRVPAPRAGGRASGRGGVRIRTAARRGRDPMAPGVPGRLSNRWTAAGATRGRPCGFSAFLGPTCSAWP